MVDANSLAELFSVRNAALVAALANLLLVFRVFNGAPKWFEQWIAYRRAKAEEKAADWSRFHEEIERLRRQRNEDQDRAEERHAAQEEENQKCRAELAAALERLATLEGYMAGQGRASQEAAGVVALERLKDRNKPKT